MARLVVVNGHQDGTGYDEIGLCVQYAKGKVLHMGPNLSFCLEFLE